MEYLVQAARGRLPGRLRAPFKRALEPAWRALCRALYRGSACTCACCGHTCRRFMPRRFKERRENWGACPNCRCLGRHRLLWLYLEQRTDLFSRPMKVLHFAPENIVQGRLKDSPGLDYLSADLESPRAMVKMDIAAIPREDASFDAILCTHVLEHVPDDRLAMRELLRVLKPGGWALLQSSIDDGLAETADLSHLSPRRRARSYGDPGHLRQYGRDYARRLAEAGFQVSEEVFPEDMTEAEIRRYGIARNRVYRCTRPPAS